MVLPGAVLADPVRGGCTGRQEQTPKCPSSRPRSGRPMAWVLYSVPSTKKSEVEAALRDDIVSRQSHKVRDAASAGGPSGQLYILVEGSVEAVDRADAL